MCALYTCTYVHTVYCICIYVSIRFFTLTNAHTHPCTHARTHTQTRMHACTHTHTHTRTHVYTHVRTHTLLNCVLCVICCPSNPEIGSKLKMPVGNKSRDLWKATTWEMAKEVSLYVFLTLTPLLNIRVGYIQYNVKRVYSVLHCLRILHSRCMMSTRGLCMLHCVGT